MSRTHRVVRCLDRREDPSDGSGPREGRRVGSPLGEVVANGVLEFAEGGDRKATLELRDAPQRTRHTMSLDEDADESVQSVTRVCPHTSNSRR